MFDCLLIVFVRRDGPIVRTKGKPDCLLIVFDRRDNQIVRTEGYPDCLLIVFDNGGISRLFIHSLR